MKRPTSVTAIAWILIVLAVVSCVSSTTGIHNSVARKLMAEDPVPVPIQFAVVYTGLAVTFVAAIAMLKGQNWGRWLYVIWSVLALVFGFATSPMKPAVIPGLVLFLIFAFFLFRPMANAFFSVTKTPEHAQGA